MKIVETETQCPIKVAIKVLRVCLLHTSIYTYVSDTVSSCFSALSSSNYRWKPSLSRFIGYGKVFAFFAITILLFASACPVFRLTDNYLQQYEPI